MRSCATKSTLLGSVGSAGICAILQIEANLVEALFGDEVFAFWTEVAAVDYGVYELVWMRSEVATGFDAADSFEAEGIPDAAGSNVGFVDEIKDRV